MLPIMQKSIDEFFGVPVTRFNLQLARGVNAFSNQNCAARLVDFNGGRKVPPLTTIADLPQDGNASRSKFAGKTIRLLLDANPRREGTKGHKSFEIVRKAGGSLSYEVYKMLGGRPNDLQWDIDHNYAEMV